MVTIVFLNCKCYKEIDLQLIVVSNEISPFKKNGLISAYFFNIER